MAWKCRPSGVATHGNDMHFRWLFCLSLGLTIPWFQEIRLRPLKVAAHFVAKYSYGIYLSHLGLIMWSSALSVPVAARALILALLAIIVPIAVFHFIGNPMVMTGQKLAKRLFEGHQDKAGAVCRQPMPHHYCGAA